MVVNTMDSQVAHLKKIEEVNEKALREVLQLRDAVGERDVGGVFEQYNNLARSVYKMGRLYAELDRDTQFINFGASFSGIEEASWRAIEADLINLKMGLKSRLNLGELIEKLNYDKRSHGFDNFEKCQTMHDLIRCLHTSSMEAFFSSVSSSVSPINQDCGKGVFTIWRNDNGENSDLLEAIQEPYKKGEKSRGRDEYKVFVTPEFLSAKAELGCHFSSLSIFLRGNDKGNLQLNFGNTSPDSYPHAPEREEYVEKVMRKIGISDVETFGIITSGRELLLPRKDLLGLISESMRMFASTRDLDVRDCPICGNVDEAVQTFMSGKTDIYSFLREKYSND